MTDKAAGVYGICLRGKAGLGREHGVPDRDRQFLRRALVRREVAAAVQHAGVEGDARLSTSTLMKADGPPGASSNGFNENLALFNDGKCGMWIDATVAAGFVTDPKQSKVADKVGFALAPDNGLGKRGNWLWAWSLAVPAGIEARSTPREKFISWATSKHYTDLVAAKEGWARVPPGTRTSLYKNPDYHEGGAVREADARLDQLGRPDCIRP